MVHSGDIKTYDQQLFLGWGGGAFQVSKCVTMPFKKALKTMFSLSLLALPINTLHLFYYFHFLLC